MSSSALPFTAAQNGLASRVAGGVATGGAGRGGGVVLRGGGLDSAGFSPAGASAARGRKSSTKTWLLAILPVKRNVCPFDDLPNAPSIDTSDFRLLPASVIGQVIVPLPSVFTLAV